jgi:ABC-2 type transport system ATP-binding protein
VLSNLGLWTETILWNNGEKMSVIAKTNNLTKQYGKQFALDRVNITINKGDIYGLVGQNGAGKTTLIKILTGLTYPTNLETPGANVSNSVELFGKSGAELAQMRKKIGCVIEAPAFFKNLTARQNLQYYCYQLGLKDNSCIDTVLKRVRLAETGKKKFGDFSLGMKQRLGIALAILNKPEFLVLDEPINGLDPTGIAEIREVLTDLQKEGVTILISSHILSELELIANKYAVIHRGKLVTELTTEDLKNQTNSGFKLAVNNPEQAVGILRDNGLNTVKIISANELLITEITSPELIIRDLVQAGILIYSAIPTGNNLEEFYFEIVRKAEMEFASKFAPQAPFNQAPPQPQNIHNKAV